MKKTYFLFFIACVFFFSNFSFAEGAGVTKSTIIGNKKITDTNYYCLYYPTTTKIGTLKSGGSYKITNINNVIKKFQTKKEFYNKKYKEAKNKAKKQRFKKLFQKFNKAYKEANTCKKYNTALLACDKFKLQVDVNDSRVIPINKTINTKVINGGKCDKKTSLSAKVGSIYENGESSTCTGTLITKDTILTAAHCLVKDEDDGEVVSVNITIGGEKYDAIWWQVNPYYDENAKGNYDRADVALVRLPSELPYVPMSLVSKNTTLKKDDIGAIIGYGITVYLNDDNYSRGFEAGFVIITKETFSGILSKFQDKYRQSNACKGDSGGPLAIYQNGEWRLAGVTSWGDDDYCGYRSGHENSWWSKIYSAENIEFIEGILGDIYSKD